MTTVSIALATYNGERFLQEQLNSLVNQTSKPAELIVGDDGSTDQTIDILENFKAQAPFPVYIHVNSERLGYQENFMRCTERCRSELIAFCDQDDVWSPAKIEQQSQVFSDPRVLLCCHTLRVTDKNGGATGRLFNPIGLAGLYTQRSLRPFAYSYGLSQMFRSILVRQNKLWEDSKDHNRVQERAAHDQWFFFLAMLNDGIFNLSEPLADYRQHERNAFGVRTRLSFRDSLKKELNRSRISEYEQLIEASDDRIRIIKELLKRTNSDLLKEADVAYRSVKNIYERRLSLYRSQDKATKAARLLRNLANGSYSLRDDPWKLSYQGALIDMLIIIAS